MSRINIDDVPALFVRTGLKPIRGDWGDFVNCGCLVTALVKDSGRQVYLPTEDDDLSECCYDDEMAYQSDRLLGKDYSQGLIDGFDGSKPSGNSDDDSAGYMDGSAAAALVFEAERSDVPESE